MEYFFCYVNVSLCAPGNQPEKVHIKKTGDAPGELVDAFLNIFYLVRERSYITALPVRARLFTISLSMKYGIQIKKAPKPGPYKNTLQ